MSKQRMARAVRKGARFAMERHVREVRRPPDVPIAPRRARWPMYLALALLVAVTLYARCGHAARAAGVLDVAGFFGVWVILAVGVCVAAFAAAELFESICSIVNYLFRGKD
jgi:hypothetical protein